MPLDCTGDNLPKKGTGNREQGTGTADVGIGNRKKVFLQI